jgi:hypothetical protein
MEMLAAVTWEDIVMVGSAMGVLTGVQVWRERRHNNNRGFNQALCDEKHRNIDSSLVNIEAHQQSISDKLDRLIEHFL